MKILSLLGIATLTLLPLSAIAAPGDLISSASYTKPGCGWQFAGAGSTGNPSDPTHRYEAHLLECGTTYVAQKTILSSTNNPAAYSCAISLRTAPVHTLSSSNCTTYEIREALPPPPVPAAPTSVHTGSTGCGGCSTPYFVSWPAVSGAAYYEYFRTAQLLRTLTYSSFVTGTLPDASGKVRACNSVNQCSVWTPLTI